MMALYVCSLKSKSKVGRKFFKHVKNGKVCRGVTSDEDFPFALLRSQQPSTIDAILAC